MWRSCFGSASRLPPPPVASLRTHNLDARPLLPNRWSWQRRDPFLEPQNVRKSRRAKMDLPSSIPAAAVCWSNQLQLETNVSTKLMTMKGWKRDQNWTLPLLISSGSTFWPFWNTFLLHGGRKTGLQHVESGCSNFHGLSTPEFMGYDSFSKKKPFLSKNSPSSKP